MTIKELPKGWVTSALGKVCDVRDGTHDSPKYQEAGKPLITSKNLTNGFVDLLPESIHQNHIFRVRLTHSEYDPVYMSWLIGSLRGKKYFLKSAKQTTGIASINMTQLRGFPILSPPIEVQRQFAEQIKFINKQVIHHIRHKQSLDNLFSPLQQRAYRGEL